MDDRGTVPRRLTIPFPPGRGRLLPALVRDGELIRHPEIPELVLAMTKSIPGKVDRHKSPSGNLTNR